MYLKIRSHPPLEFKFASSSQVSTGIMKSLVVFSFVFSIGVVSSLKFDVREVDYNLNGNKAASNPLEYSGEWPNHKYHASPDNWRFPFYTLMLDRFVK